MGPYLPLYAADITLCEAEKKNIHIVPINIEFVDGNCPQEYRMRLLPIGGVIGTHLGTNGVGLAYVAK